VEGWNVRDTGVIITYFIISEGSLRRTPKLPSSSLPLAVPPTPTIPCDERSESRKGFGEERVAVRSEATSRRLLIISLAVVSFQPSTQPSLCSSLYLTLGPNLPKRSTCDERAGSNKARSKATSGRVISYCAMMYKGGAYSYVFYAAAVALLQPSFAPRPISPQHPLQTP